MRRLGILLIVGVVLVGAGEVFARYGLGLGTPPLSVSHESIEYMFAPNQDVRRFGNRQLYNEYSMRNVSMSEVDQPHRVLVFGDSVLNGGSLTDHDALATTLATDQDTFFGNVSAGSWGPDNILAWIDEFGLLDAEAVILLISSHDLYDAPTFDPLNPMTHPTRPPTSALLEGVRKYLPRYLPSFLLPGSPEAEAVEPVKVSTSEAIVGIVDRAKAAGVKLCVVQHKTPDELEAPEVEESREIREIFAARDVPVIDFGPALAKSEDNPYRDNIHINDHGQTLLAKELSDCHAAARVPAG